MTQTNRVFETGLIFHIISAFLWIPLFYVVTVSIWTAFVVGFLSFQVVGWAIMLSVFVPRLDNKTEEN